MASPLAGSSLVRTVTERQIHWSLQSPPQYLAGGGLIDSAKAIDGKNTGFTNVLRKGCLMARINSTKKWVPCKRSLAVGAQGGGGSVSLTVDNAAFFKAGDKITIGGGELMTISSVNYTTNVITLTTAYTWSDNAVVIGAGVLAGSGTALAVLDEDVDLYDPKTRADRDMQTGKLCIEGCLKEDMMLGDLDAVQADTGAKLSRIIWDQQQGYSAQTPETTA